MTAVADVQTVEKIVARVAIAYRAFGIETSLPIKNAMVGGIVKALEEAEAERGGEPIYARADMARAWNEGWRTGWIGEAGDPGGLAQNPHVEAEPEPRMIPTNNPELWREL